MYRPHSISSLRFPAILKDLAAVGSPEHHGARVYAPQQGCPLLEDMRRNRPDGTLVGTVKRL